MRRKAAAGGFALALFFILHGCTGGGEAPPGAYTSAEFGFSIVFPEGWEVEEPGGGELPVVAASLIPKGEPGIMLAYVAVEIDDLDDAVTLEEYAGRIRSEQSRDAKYFSEHEYGEIRIDGRKARYLFIDVDWEDSTLRLLGYILVDKRKGYLITCGAIPDEFERYQAIFRQTARSFRIE
ncbi:MAG TPA: hypothetical protein VLA34_08100 [Candidatus Krumholzibacterium sp.]|nr:hypothetical protein [Candidatus Krumholzibacterium sp.]